MEKLNPSQEKAVRHFGRPLLIVAGAGSGKTKTLAHKVEFLIKERGIDPSRILAITFTNKAGREIKDRVLKTAGVELSWAGTFHSVALRILKEKGKRFGYSRNLNIISEADRNRLVKNIASKLNLQQERLKSYLSSRIEDLCPPEEGPLELAFEEYLRVLKESNLIDFSGLMLYLYRLLQSEPHIGRDFDFILVDEFQDTNTIQYEILKLLARDNICAVGDPNQCIYEWRYARPDNLMRFREDFNADIIKLEYNYRSRPFIIQVANALLASSGASWKELIPTLRAVRAGEEKPVVRRFEKEEEEALWIGTKIKELLNTYRPSQIAILVRVGYVTDALERALYNLKIPYRLVGAVRFFERAEVRDALSFLRILINPQDRLAFGRALEVATRGLGERSLELIVQAGRGDCLKGSEAVLRSLPKAKALELYNFLQKLLRLKKGIPEYPVALEEFLREIDFWSYLQESYKDWEEREENVKELLRFLRQKHSEGYSLEDVFQEIGFLTEQEEQEGSVRIMTIHASKGLEFEVVFLPRLEEGILPHEKAKDTQEELEEELRLFYVAVTRAKDFLFMTYTRSSKPSRFLSYIPKDLLDLSSFLKKKTSYMPELKGSHSFTKGDRVFHEVFGEGFIISLEDSKAVVEFKGGTRTIHTAFLKLL